MKKMMLKLGMGLMFVAALSFAACGNQQASADTVEHTEEHSHDGDDHSHDHDGADHSHDHGPHGEGAAFTSSYVCPMHCEGSGSEEEGKCPACGMDYVALAEHTKDGHSH